MHLEIEYFHCFHFECSRVNHKNHKKFDRNVGKVISVHTQKLTILTPALACTRIEYTVAVLRAFKSVRIEQINTMKMWKAPYVRSQLKQTTECVSLVVVVFIRYFACYSIEFNGMNKYRLAHVCACMCVALCVCSKSMPAPLACQTTARTHIHWAQMSAIWKPLVRCLWLHGDSHIRSQRYLVRFRMYLLCVRCISVQASQTYTSTAVAIRLLRLELMLIQKRILTQLCSDIDKWLSCGKSWKTVVGMPLPSQ